MPTQKLNSLPPQTTVKALAGLSPLVSVKNQSRLVHLMDSIKTSMAKLQMADLNFEIETSVILKR